MAAWVLVPSLVSLREEFNEIAPGRDKASDGSVADQAHRDKGTSDHIPDEESDALRDHDADSKNEVHAIDVDRDLREPGVTMEACVQLILARCRSGQETRLKYIIFNRRIWSASSGWRQNAYTGSNPHDHHAHFSSKYDTASEGSTRSWGLEEEFMAIDYNQIRSIVREEVRNAVSALQTQVSQSPSAQQNAEATFSYSRNNPKAPYSDTARNLLEANITEAIVEGVAIERYPFNVGKS